MSQTPITVTYSLEEILQDINSKLDKMDEKFEAKFEKIETKLDKIEERLTKLEVGQGEMKTELKGINKRLDSQEFINRSVAIGVIVALVTGVVKLFFPNFPNLPIS
ncbi:MAG: hypothetical protein WBM32_07765 [Crocosphaera sp.]|jgi:predicted nuclease with TOPRIM domain